MSVKESYGGRVTQDWQQRVLEEREQLVTRATKLNAFIHSSMFAAVPGPERKLLLKQIEVMLSYIKILDGRVDLWD